jgi:hypothetical protein
MVDPYSKQWKAAADKEIAQFEKMSVYEWAELPPGSKLMTGRWIFTLKRQVDLSVDKFKGRFVVQGFRSVPGIHHTETFAPTADSATARCLLAVAAVRDWEAEQMDVTAAFLYGPLHEDIYLVPPEGYEDGSGRVWKLRKALYGLKQAP